MVTIQTQTILALHTSSSAIMVLHSMKHVPTGWFIIEKPESVRVKCQTVLIIALGLDMPDHFPLSCMPNVDYLFTMKITTMDTMRYNDHPTVAGSASFFSSPDCFV